MLRCVNFYNNYEGLNYTAVMIRHMYVRTQVENKLCLHWSYGEKILINLEMKSIRILYNSPASLLQNAIAKELFLKKNYCKIPEIASLQYVSECHNC